MLCASCAGPFRKEVLDAEPPEGSLRIVSVDEAGLLLLADGRTVRIFGVRIDEDVPDRGEAIAWLRERVGTSATVQVILPEDPPAVWILQWELSYPSCGNALATWNPFAKYYADYWGRDLGYDLIDMYPGCVSEWDLTHPAAPSWIVEDLRSRIVRDR